MWLNCTHFKLFLEKNNKIVARIVEKEYLYQNK